MKWFFALNDASSRFDDYATMLKVAVASALRHTSLEPHFLFDGAASPLTTWLEHRGVRVIHARTALFPAIEAHYRLHGDHEFLTTAAGAYLRTDLPRIMQELGYSDRFVLYTDCDVLFVRDVTEVLERQRPRYFSVAPEDDPSNYRRMNSGVMVMNIPRLRRRDADFLAFATTNLGLLPAFDQGAYREYYKAPLIPFALWNRLPLELNWKPYWGVNPRAGIVHFHGPKPTEADALRAGGGTASHRRFLADSFFHYALEWASYLEDVRTDSVAETA